jgi:hypothetical protein
MARPGRRHSLSRGEIVLLEVFKRMRQQRGRTDAYRAVAQMRLGRAVDLDCKPAIADSIVLATAEASSATIWTQDADFEGMKSVRHRRKRWSRAGLTADICCITQN